MPRKFLACIVLSIMLAGCGGTPPNDKRSNKEPVREDLGEHLPISDNTLVHDSKSLAAWIEQLKGGNPQERASAARALGEFRSPKVKTKIGKEDYLSREELALARREVARALPLLIEACRQSDNELLRRRACAALFEIGDPNKIPLQALIALLADESAGVNPRSAGYHPFEGSDLSFVNLCQIVRELIARGEAARAAAPLCEILFEEIGNQKCDNGQLLQANARGLTMPALPMEVFQAYDLGLVTEATEGREEELRRVKNAVRPYGTLAVVLLQDLTRLLKKVGTAAPAPLAKAIEDPDPAIRFAATLGISRLGTKARELAPKVRKGLDEKSPRNRLHAGVALLAADRKADPAILVAFRKALSDNPALRSGVQAKHVVAILITVIDEEESWEPRALAAELLGELGPVASPAIQVLVGLRNDAKVQVRKVAVEALKKIQSDK